MPTPEFGGLGLSPSLPEVVDYVHKLEKELNYLLQNLDTLNVSRLDAKVIKTGTLDANLVTVKSDLAGSSYLQIDGLGIRANNGFINTFEIDSTGQAYFRGNITSDAVITGAKVQTAASGRRIEMANNQLSAYGSNGSPRIQFREISAFDYYELWFLNSFGTQMGVISASSSQFNIAAQNGANMVLGGNIYVGSGSAFVFQASNTVSGLRTDAVGSHNHGIPSGTVLMTDGGGTVTFVASGGHSHNVTT